MAQKRFVADVYSVDRNKQTTSVQSGTLLTSGVTYKVLQRNSDTAETLLAIGGPDGSAVTAKTNPVTTTVFAVDGRIEFVCDPTEATDTYVDLIVVDTNGGYTAFVEDFTSDIHAIYIDETPNVDHHGMIWFTYNDNVATDTGVNFLPDTAIKEVIVEILTVDNTETLNVGTADTAAGFISALSLATASEGYKTDTGFITGGTNIDYTPATQYGSLLATAITGSDAVATNGGNTRKWHFVVTSGVDDDLYYTCSAGSDTAAGFIHFWFSRLR